MEGGTAIEGTQVKRTKARERKSSLRGPRELKPPKMGSPRGFQIREVGLLLLSLSKHLSEKEKKDL